MSAQDLLERRRELATAEGLLDVARERAGSVLVIEGAAGIGKTRLLEAVCDRAGDAGFGVHRARAAELEGDLAWGVVRHLFAGLVRRVSRTPDLSVFAGAAGLALSVLGLVDSPVSAGDALSRSMHGLYWLTANLADEQPLLIAVDDAQWADGASTRFLGYLAQRLIDIPVLLAVTVRTGEPHAAAIGAALRGSPRSDVLSVGPLSIGATRRVIAAHTGSEPDPEFARACHERPEATPTCCISWAPSWPATAFSRRRLRWSACARSGPGRSRTRSPHALRASIVPRSTWRARWPSRAGPWRSRARRASPTSTMNTRSRWPRCSPRRAF
jgi:hypothetical protein